MRLKNKIAIIIGAGQTTGQKTGNGRSIAITFAREGAKVFLADINLNSANETKEIIEFEGGISESIKADVTKENDCKMIAK